MDTRYQATVPGNAGVLVPIKTVTVPLQREPIRENICQGCGQTIRSCLEMRMESMGKNFRSLLRSLMQRSDLSIQVHPDNDYAREHENGSLGKTECWYILDSEPGTKIVIGHYAKDKEELKQMVEEKRWKDLIREVPVKKGDFYQIDPGCVHAIKGGTVILETQQSSDITYRVYDYDRKWNGKLRELHVKQSLDVIKPHSSLQKTREALPIRKELIWNTWKHALTTQWKNMISTETGIMFLKLVL